MNKTTCQNGASSSPLYDQRSMPSTPTSQETPHDSRFVRSSKHPTSEANMPVSSYKMRGSEIFQSREVLLEMLQPPVLYVPGSGCSYQDDVKTCSKADESHCSRCVNFQPHNILVHVNTKASEQWSPKTKNCICVPPRNNGDLKESISYRETGEKQLHRDLETSVNLPCDEEDFLRTSKTSVLFPTTAPCPTCEGRSRPIYPEAELHLGTARYQQVLADCQKHSNGGDWFNKETFPNVPYSARLHKERKIESKRVVKSNSESPRKEHGYPPTWSYHDCDSRTYQPPISSQTLSCDHPDMDTASEEVPDEVQSAESRVKKVSHYLDARFQTSEPSRPVPENCGFAPTRPLDESLQYQGHEERNTRLENASAKHNHALPHCPNESSQEECTPVIVHCYSLSELGSSCDSQIMNRHKTNASLSISKEVASVPDRHSHIIHQLPPQEIQKPVNRLQVDERVLYDSPAPHPRSNTIAYNCSYNTQPKNVMNEASTTDVDDEQKQNGSALLPSRVHEKSRPPVSCRCLHCPPCPRENGYDKTCTQATRRSTYPPFPEPTRKTSENVSQIHIPNGYQRAHPTPDRLTEVEFGSKSFCNWPNKQVSYGSRSTLKIQDYYEGRRILVENDYKDIPGSVEGAESEQRSNISYAHRGELYHECHQHRHSAGADAVQTTAFDDSSFDNGVNQQDITVGSKKRKSRQPRPQRVKPNDPAQFARSGGEQVQYEEVRQEEPFKNRYNQQTNLSYLHDTSFPKEACRKTREDAEVCGTENMTRSSEDVQAKVPVHLGSVRRSDDNVSKNTPSRSRVYRPPDTQPPCHPPSDGRKIIERYEQFFEFPRVPSRDVISNRGRPTNSFSLKHQNNRHCQSKIPQQNFGTSYKNVPKRQDNLRAERNVAQQHWHTPARMEGLKKHFETLEKGGAGYDGGHRTRPSRVRMASFGPSQHNMPNQGSAVFQTEMDPEPLCNGEATPEYADKPQSDNSNTPSSSLPSDHDRFPSATIDNSDGSQKTPSSDRSLQPDQAYAPIDGYIPMKPTEEQNGSFSESHNLFIERQEGFANCMTSNIKERRFTCRFCCKKFAHFSTLQNHVRTHTGDKPFQCKFCSRRFAQSGVLKAHLRTHTGDKPFVCMYCGKMFAQSTTLTNHLRTHTGQKPYICEYCGKSFSQPSTLRKHELSHTKERPYLCKFCGKSFAQQSTLTNHMRSHTGQRPYKCHFCEKCFAQLSTLDRHQRVHSSVSLKPHQCEHCNKSFSYFSNLTSHMQVHEQEQQLKVV